MNAICVHNSFWHDATLPPPVSEFKAILLFVRSHAARGWKASALEQISHMLLYGEREKGAESCDTIPLASLIGTSGHGERNRFFTHCLSCILGVFHCYHYPSICVRRR